MALPVGYEAKIRPRSGLAAKKGITLINSPGTIDADYRGEVMTPVINLGKAHFIVERGMRIAQMLNRRCRRWKSSRWRTWMRPRGGEADLDIRESTEARNESEFERDALQWWTVFTGIIEQSVPVANIVDGPRFKRMTIPNPWPTCRGGESISVNGCCLTVAEMMEGKIGFDVVIETLSRTNLGLLRNGDRVHLRRSLGRGIGWTGHFVQGHVDGTAKIDGWGQMGSRRYG